MGQGFRNIDPLIDFPKVDYLNTQQENERLIKRMFYRPAGSNFTSRPDMFCKSVNWTQHRQILIFILFTNSYQRPRLPSADSVRSAAVGGLTIAF